MNKKLILLGLALAASATAAVAQYPAVTSEAGAAYRRMMEKERRLSDEAWEKALPIVLKEAREGRPYVPWAHRPYDLPQAQIPARSA